MNLVSIIICHHKGNLIEKAIESLLRSKEAFFEIIIVSSAKDLCLPHSLVIYSEEGPARKRNLGVSYSRGQYLSFFDDDIEVNEWALYSMYRALNNDPKTGMVFGKLLNMEFRNRLDEAGSFLTKTGFLYARSESGIEDKGQFEEIEPILAGKSAACMIHKSIFKEAGGFDESFEILGEETDLAWRVWLLGYQVLYVPQSVTYHAFNTRFKSLDYYHPRRIYFNGPRNYITMLIKNLELRNLIIPLICQLLAWSTAAIGMILTGKLQAGCFIIQGLLYLILNSPNILAKRKLLQKKRTIKDKELFSYVLRSPPRGYYWRRLLKYIKIGLHG